MTYYNAGTLVLEVFEAPYTLPDVATAQAFQFDELSWDPGVFFNIGATSVICQAGVNDFGIVNTPYVALGAASVLNNGQFWSFNRTDNPSSDNISFSWINGRVPPFGGKEGEFLPAPAFYGESSSRPQSNTSAVGFNIGYNPFTQQGKGLGIAVEYHRGFIDNNFAYLQTPLGYQFDQGTPYSGGGICFNELGWQMWNNYFEYASSIFCNRTGMLLGPAGGDNTVKFLPWEVYGKVFYTPIPPISRLPDSGGPMIFGAIQDFEDPSLNDIWTQGVQNAEGFFIGLAGSMFLNQPQTPILFDPSRGAYRPVQLLPRSNAARTLLSFGDGLQLKYSSLEQTFIIYNNHVKGVPFNTQIMNIYFNPPFIPPLPVIGMPCFNPCVPAIVL